LRRFFNTRSDNTNADVYRLIGIGYDAANTIADGSLTGQSEGAAGRPGPKLVASLGRACEAGLHYVQEPEFSSASGTTTWLGDGGAPSVHQTGMTLMIDL
jgi:hypothetical protein